jgi:predicted small lipoprotein YifL
LLALLILTAPIALTACGQKGALYLTADPIAQPAGTDAVATEEEAKKEKSQSTD